MKWEQQVWQAIWDSKEKRGQFGWRKKVGVLNIFPFSHTIVCEMILHTLQTQIFPTENWIWQRNVAKFKWFFVFVFQFCPVSNLVGKLLDICVCYMHVYAH